MEKMLVTSMLSKIFAFSNYLFYPIKYKFHHCITFKGCPFRPWDENFTKILKKSSLYSQSLLIFIHRTLVVERHPTTREIRDLLWSRSTPTGNTVYLYISSSFIYTLQIHRRSFKHSIR